MNIIHGDSRHLKLVDESVDHIISSPPYYNTLDYINSHRLRLCIHTVYDEDEQNLKIKLFKGSRII